MSYYNNIYFCLKFVSWFCPFSLCW